MVFSRVDPVKRRISLGLSGTCRIRGGLRRKHSRRWVEVARARQEQTDSVCSSVSKAMSTAMVHLSDLDLTVPASRLSTSSRRATWFAPRCSTSMSTRSASRLASSSSPAIPSPMRVRSQGSGRDLRGRGSEGCRHRRQDRRYDLSAFIRRAELAATAPTSAPSASRPVTRSMPASPSSTARRGCHAVDQGARSGRGEGGDRTVRLPDSVASLGDILGAALKKQTQPARKKKTSKQVHQSRFLAPAGSCRGGFFMRPIGQSR